MFTHGQHHDANIHIFSKWILHSSCKIMEDMKAIFVREQSIYPTIFSNFDQCWLVFGLSPEGIDLYTKYCFFECEFGVEAC